MKVCIRCNPVSELHETDEGLRCRVHGDQYVVEEQPEKGDIHIVAGDCIIVAHEGQYVIGESAAQAPPSTPPADAFTQIGSPPDTPASDAQPAETTLEQ